MITEMKKTKDETSLLYNEIYKNAAMGAGTTKHLLGGKRGEKMNESLQKQYAEYLAICRNAAVSERARGGGIKGLSRMSKMMTDSAVSLNTLFDRSDGNVARLLVQGGAMGVANAEKMLNEYKGADEDARALMRHLSDFELSTIEEMKPCL